MDNTSDDAPTSAFFGGTINPSSDILYCKYDQCIDSLDLNERIVFHEDTIPLILALFKIEHLPENQMVLIEAGDSIWSYANMADFNASLSLVVKVLLRTTF